MNPCFLKACSPKFDLSSAMPVSTVAFLAVLAFELGGRGGVVVGDEDPVAVSAFPQAGLTAGRDLDPLDYVSPERARLHPVAELGHLALPVGTGTQ